MTETDPYGRILRHVQRTARRVLIGDGLGKGGLFGLGGSPRVEGAIDKLGFDCTEISLVLQHALNDRRSANGIRRQNRANSPEVIAPLLRAIVEHDRNVEHRGKHKKPVCNRAADVLNEITSDLKTDEYAAAKHPEIQRVANTVIESGVLVSGQDGFSGETIRDWFSGISFREMLEYDGIRFDL